jgi:hypothetical protein
MTEMLERSCIWCYYRPMNKLDVKKRAQILACLVEGNSIRATVRMTGAAKNTVVKLLADVGAACAAYQDKTLRNLPCKRLQCDEIWSFVYAKAKNVATAKAAPEGAGDAWTWTAIDADTKLVAAWMVGPRDSGVAYDFMQDLAARLSHRVQLTTVDLTRFRGHLNDWIEGVHDGEQSGPVYAGIQAANGGSGAFRTHPGVFGERVRPDVLVDLTMGQTGRARRGQGRWRTDEHGA